MAALDGVTGCEQEVVDALEVSPVAGIERLCRRVHVSLTGCD